MIGEMKAGLDIQVGLDIMKRMLRIRRFEERVEALQAAGELYGVVHLYVGQEGIAAGVCAALQDDDYITSTHRGHGHIVAKGGDFKRCMAELFGRETGYCKGKGGSMHLADITLGIIGANGIVGAGIPIGTGAGLAAKLRGSTQVSISFFGDGAASTGAFHESLNLATVWSLPVVFICENNGWSELTRTERVTACGAVAQHAEAYGIPGVKIDGNDALAVYAASSEAVARARAGDGPTLIEALTYRIAEHSQGLEAIVKQIRTDEELDEWRARDPIVKLGAALVDAGASTGELDTLDRAITAELDAAVEFARKSPRPPLTSAFTDVWLEAPAVGTQGGVS